jgi:3-oxoacyl-[acyl-carrier protein] reductase
MKLELDEKVIIVSGSSRGIGKGICQVLLGEGAFVALTGRDESSLKQTNEEINREYPNQSIYVAGDLNERSTLENIRSKVLGRWSQIDGIVANAGAVKPVPEWDIQESDWQWYFKANFEIAFRFITHFIPDLKVTKGNVVITSSIAGIEDIGGAPLPYSSSKAALNMYAKGLASKLASDSIRVNTVAPGNIVFPGGNWDLKSKKNPRDIQKMLREKVPLQSFGEPSDIGNMVAFLLSSKAKFITGSCFVVDGGQSSLFI